MILFSLIEISWWKIRPIEWWSPTTTRMQTTIENINGILSRFVFLDQLMQQILIQFFMFFFLLFPNVCFLLFSENCSRSIKTDFHISHNSNICQSEQDRERKENIYINILHRHRSVSFSFFSSRSLLHHHLTRKHALSVFFSPHCTLHGITKKHSPY